jgi:hypothetical protein
MPFLGGGPVDAVIQDGMESINPSRVERYVELPLVNTDFAIGRKRPDRPDRFGNPAEYRQETEQEICFRDRSRIGGIGFCPERPVGLPAFCR